MATDDDEAAGVLRIGVGLGVDRVVVVAGVRRVDGDERQVPQILAALQVGLFAACGFGEHGCGKTSRDAVRMDGDQADRLLRSTGYRAAR